MTQDENPSQDHPENQKIMDYTEYFFWFLTEEIQYHDGLRSRELGQAPILLCAPNSYTANVCRDLQGLCGEIRVRDFKFTRIVCIPAITVIF